MEEYAKKIEKVMLKKQMVEAAKDPLFMKDLQDSMEAFETSDAETTRRVQEW